MAQQKEPMTVAMDAAQAVQLFEEGRIMANGPPSLAFDVDRRAEFRKELLTILDSYETDTVFLIELMAQAYEAGRQAGDRY